MEKEKKEGLQEREGKRRKIIESIINWLVARQCLLPREIYSLTPPLSLKKKEKKKKKKKDLIKETSDLFSRNAHVGCQTSEMIHLSHLSLSLTWVLYDGRLSGHQRIRLWQKQDGN